MTQAAGDQVAGRALVREHHGQGRRRQGVDQVDLHDLRERGQLGVSADCLDGEHAHARIEFAGCDDRRGIGRFLLALENEPDRQHGDDHDSRPDEATGPRHPP